MRIIPLIITLLVASPAFAQSRIYTNADLRRPLFPTSTVTPAEAAAILAPYQFVYVEPAPRWGPRFVVLRSNPADGPFGAFHPFAPGRRLDGTPLSEPPWSMTTYVGRHRYSRRDSGDRMGGHLLPPKGQSVQ